MAALLFSTPPARLKSTLSRTQSGFQATVWTPELHPLMFVVVKGQPFNPDARMKKIRTDAAVIGNAAARAISFSPRAPEQYFYGKESA